MLSPKLTKDGIINASKIAFFMLRSLVSKLPKGHWPKLICRQRHVMSFAFILVTIQPVDRLDA